MKLTGRHRSRPFSFPNRRRAHDNDVTNNLKELIVQTQVRYREIDHADWDGNRYRTYDTAKWEQAARETAPADWQEYVRILAQGWDSYGGSSI